MLYFDFTTREFRFKDKLGLSKFDNTPLTEKQFLALYNICSQKDDRLSYIPDVFFKRGNSIYLRWNLPILIAGEIAGEMNPRGKETSSHFLESSTKMALMPDYATLGYKSEKPYPLTHCISSLQNSIVVIIPMDREAGIY